MISLVPKASVCSSLHLEPPNKIFIRRKIFPGFHLGVNKADEYSWFFLLALEGQAGETIELFANMSEQDQESLTRDNSLLFYSIDKHHWHRLRVPVWTDQTGLKQHAIFNMPHTGTVYISNTVFFSLPKLRDWFHSFSKQHDDLCRINKLGQSLLGHPLEMFSLTRATKPQGTILITTGCHPAEPDVVASQAIMEYLASASAIPLLNRYQVDFLPVQNPDGFAEHSCLTHNGINLYWNFRYDDQKNCPEAYYLWQYIKQQPPLVYLDFHAYVHQYHRPSMPYIKPRQAYTGAYTKFLVRKMDSTLIKHAQGYYRFGKLAMWPHALSQHITTQFNTIAYTKYHFNLYAGLNDNRQRAVSIFQKLAAILSRHNVQQRQVLLPPFGETAPDWSDSVVYSLFLNISDLSRRLIVLIKAYTRYYLHRNRNHLFRSQTPDSSS